MIISHKHKFAFVKTRKTAGSTVEKILYPILGEKDICTGSTRDDTPALNSLPDTNGHIPYRSLITMYPEIRDYFVFTVERNPWDKCVSAFYWHKKIKPYLTAKGFENYLETASGMLPRDWVYYGGDYDKIKVFQYEDLHNFIPKMNELFALDIDSDLINTTKCKEGIREESDYRKLYNERSKEIVADLFQNEIREFGYEF